MLPEHPSGGSGWRNNRLAYLVLWPHARRWQFSSPQPALRCIADADRIAGLLAAALTSSPLPKLPVAETARSREYQGTPVAAQ